MRDKTRMGLERFEVGKTRAFSLDFPEIPKITEILEMRSSKEGHHEILEILQILEMGLSQEWVVLKIVSK